MRILGGVWRGRPLAVPKGIRPTGGRVKEALLSRWQGSIPGGAFLDLFAGSGAVGFEAASRGAREVVLVERSPSAIRSILDNRKALGAENCRVLRAALPDLPAGVLASAPFDQVFADPPYDFEAYGSLLERIGEVLTAQGEVAIEHSRRLVLEPVESGLGLRESRDYGESRLSFFARPPGS